MCFFFFYEYIATAKVGKEMRTLSISSKSNLSNNVHSLTQSIPRIKIINYTPEHITRFANLIVTLSPLNPCANVRQPKEKKISTRHVPFIADHSLSHIKLARGQKQCRLRERNDENGNKHKSANAFFLGGNQMCLSSIGIAVRSAGEEVEFQVAKAIYFLRHAVTETDK